jgi:hypothetical protein
LREAYDLSDGAARAREAQSVCEVMMSEPEQDQSELGAFLRAELAGVDLEGISLEPVPVVRWQSAIQSRLRAIAGYQDGTTILPVAHDMA